MSVDKPGGGGVSSSPSLCWGGQGADKDKGLQEVKNSYASVDEYLGVFEPLLFEEGKPQILQGRRNEDEGEEEDEISLD